MQWPRGLVELQKNKAWLPRGLGVCGLNCRKIVIAVSRFPCTSCDHITLNRKYHLAKVSPLAAPKCVLYKISCVTIDENFVNMAMFPFQCIWGTSQILCTWSSSILCCSVIQYENPYQHHSEAQHDGVHIICDTVKFWGTIWRLHTHAYLK